MKIKAKNYLIGFLLLFAISVCLFSFNEAITVANAEETTLLAETNFTVTSPAVGETYDTNIVSAEEEKYTATFVRVYDDTDRKNIGASDEFQVGHTYTYEILVTAGTGYTIDSNTKVYINGKQAGSYSVGDYYVSFELPKCVTVVGGTRCTDDNYNEEYTGEDFYGGYVYVKADPAPEGKVFHRWDIVKENGSSTYSTSEKCMYYVDTPSITFTAVYSNHIEEIKIEMPKITVGGNPSFTNIVKTDANAENYEFVINEWYYYENGTNKVVMTEADTFEKGVSYHISYSIQFAEGYWMPSDYDEYITINGNSVYTNSCNYILGEVYGTHSFHTLIPMNVSVTGGTLMVDGVPTNETEFMPGTELTLVVDESLYPEGKVFRYWNLSGSQYIIYEDNRTPSFTFTLKDYRYSPPYYISISAIYTNLSALTGTYVYAMHPVAGETPSYEIYRRGSEYDTEVLGWYENDTLLDNSHVFELGKTYTIRVKATAAPSYYINDPNKNFRGDISFNGLLVFDGEIIEYEENGAYVIYEHSIVAKYAQTSAAITIDTPIPGKLPFYEVVKDSGTNINVYIDYWKVYDSEKGWREMEDDEIFMVGGEYRPYIVFQGNEDYFVKSPNFAVTINGEKGSSYSSGSNPYAEGYYTVFTVLANAETYDVIIENGTASIDSTTILETGAGVVVTITANTPEEGKAFKCWQIVSGTNVIIVDANSAKTTFAMPAGNVSIKAVYRYTPHEVVVVGGSADMTNVGKEETVTITVGEIPTGKYFSHWAVNAGGVELLDANAKTTTFVMSEIAVEIEAIFADQTVLEEVRFTVTAPLPGQLYDGSLASTEPTKYTATFSHIIHGSVEFDIASPYVAGARYNYHFYITFDEKYTTNSSTKFYLNTAIVYKRSGNEYYSNAITTPYPITVVNGGAFNDKAGTTSVANLFQYDYFYIIADPAPEGFKFHHWDVLGSYNWVDASLNKEILNVRQGSETLTFTAVYEDLHTITVMGGTADASEAIVGTKIYITKGAIPDGKVFLYWSLNGANIGNVSNFIMPDEDVVIDAVYHTHTYDENVWEYNEGRHWHECTDVNCPDINHSISYNGQYYHKYDHACDTDCNDGCGYTRVITHDFTGAWVTDENQHWHVCKVAGCGEIDEKVNHSGGTATCITKAKCETCGKEYGSYDANNHEEEAVWYITAEKHEKYYECCETEVVAEENHNLVGGVCSECEFDSANVIDSVVINGLNVPLYNQPVGYFSYLLGESIDDGCLTINGKAYDDNTDFFGNIYLVDFALLDENRNEISDDNHVITSGTYYVGFMLAPATGYPFTADATATVDGAKSVDAYFDDYLVVFAKYEIAPEIIDEIIVNGVAPEFGLTRDEYYETTMDMTINGVAFNEGTGTFGKIGMEYGAILDDNDDELDGNEILEVGTYYVLFVLYPEYGCTFPIDIQDLAITFEGSVDVAFEYNEGFLVIYAKYVITYTCVGQKVDGQSATCTVDGWRDYYECECGKYYEEENCTTPILDLAAWKIGDGKIAATHTGTAEWIKTATTHEKKYTCCEDVVVEEENHHWVNGVCSECEYTCLHTGGTATCTAKAICEKCNTAYGDMLIHSHGSTWETDENNHWNECACGDKANVNAHVDSDSNGKCDTCDYDMPTTPGGGSETPENPDEPNDGLSGGAIAGIAVGSTAVAGIGVFALIWFVIKKKSLAELLAIFKKK